MATQYRNGSYDCKQMLLFKISCCELPSKWEKNRFPSFPRPILRKKLKRAGEGEEEYSTGMIKLRIT